MLSSMTNVVVPVVMWIGTDFSFLVYEFLSLQTDIAQKTDKLKNLKTLVDLQANSKTYKLKN